MDKAIFIGLNFWSTFWKNIFYLKKRKSLIQKCWPMPDSVKCKPIALKYRRHVSALFLCCWWIWGSLWMVGRTCSSLLLDADLLFCLCSARLSSQSCCWDLGAPGPEVVLILEGLGGPGGAWRMSGQHICYQTAWEGSGGKTVVTASLWTFIGSCLSPFL